MKVIFNILAIFISTISTSALAWEAEVTRILQHGSATAVYLSPDPGVGQCSYGQPYILIVDGSPESSQKFSMLLTALTTGKKIVGWEDACSTAIWAQSRPTIYRLMLKK